MRLVPNRCSWVQPSRRSAPRSDQRASLVRRRDKVHERLGAVCLTPLFVGTQLTEQRAISDPNLTDDRDHEDKWVYALRETSASPWRKEPQSKISSPRSAAREEEQADSKRDGGGR